MSQPYLAALVLDGQPCVVVGAGVIATGKVSSLLAAGARVSVIAPRASDEIQASAAAGLLVWHKRPFAPSDLDGAMLVVASTDSPQLHEEIHAEATARGIFVNVVDVPDLCTFLVPAVHRDGPITIAVSTAGASPSIAKRVRDIVAAQTVGYGALAERLRAERAWSRAELATYEDRQRFFESILDGEPDPLVLVRDKRWDALDALIASRRAEALGQREDG